MKKLFLAVLASFLCLTAISCGNNGNRGDVNADEGYDGSEVEIVFYHTMGQNLRNVLDLYIAEFNKIYPNITVTHSQEGNYDGVRDKIKNELTVGESPNIAYCYPDHVAMYNSANAVQTLDDLIASDAEVVTAEAPEGEDYTRYQTLGLSQAEIDDFIKGYYDEGKQFGDGKMYSMPFSKSTEVLYYNKTFFTANNIPVPDHWFSVDENDTTSMEAVCRRIKEIDPTSIPLGYDSEANLFITMCEQLNIPYTSATGEHFLFDNAQAKEFCKKFRNWYQDALMTTQDLYGAYTSGLFKEVDPTKQKSYMSIGSSAGATNQRPDMVNGEYPFEVAITSIPQADVENNPAVISQGPSVCIFKKDDNMEVIASWLFVKFLTTSVEFQAEFSMASGYVPVLKSVMNNPVYAKFLAGANGGSQIAALSAKQCLEQESYYFTSPAFAGSSQARDEVGKLLKKVIANAAENGVDKLLDDSFAEAVNNCKFFS